MNLTPLLNTVTSQQDFAEMVGVSEARISQLMTDGVLVRGDTAHAWLVGYCERLRDQAAGRLGDSGGGLDLVQERAALARSQRIAQDMKNAVARGEYAPTGLLADVLSAAGSGLVDRFDQLEGTLRKSCPDLPHEAVEAILAIMASARNEWIRSTQRLVIERLDAMTTDEDDVEADLFEDDDGAVAA